MNSNAAYPCDGCADRAVGCHAACERYLTARAVRDARREADHKRRDNNAAARACCRMVLNGPCGGMGECEGLEMKLEDCTKEELIFFIKQSGLLSELDLTSEILIFRADKANDDKHQLYLIAAQHFNNYMSLTQPFIGKPVRDIPDDIIKKAQRNLSYIRNTAENPSAHGNAGNGYRNKLISFRAGERRPIMNREILFRGKQSNGEWAYGFYVFVPKGRFCKPEHMI